MREKDGVWAALAWLQILAAKGVSIEQLLDGTLGRIWQKDTIMKLKRATCNDPMVT